MGVLLFQHAQPAGYAREEEEREKTEEQQRKEDEKMEKRLAYINKHA